MTYQHSSFPVTVTLTSKNGVFLVCELKGSTSEVARERQDLEKRLSSCVLRTLLEAECSSDEVDDTTLSENEVR